MAKIKEIDMIVEGLISYQKEIEAFHTTKNQIKMFKKISYDFFKKSLKTKSEELFLGLVKDYVMAINDINEAADYALIETMEREAIYSFIESVCSNIGYTFDYDITEEYREW